MKRTLVGLFIAIFIVFIGVFALMATTSALSNPGPSKPSATQGNLPIPQNDAPKPVTDSEPSPKPNTTPEPEPTDNTPQVVKDLMNTMTTEEMVGQLFFPRCPEKTALSDIEKFHVGGYVLFGRDFIDEKGNWITEKQFVATIQKYQDTSKIPLLIGVDEEGGSVVRMSQNPNLKETPYLSPQALEYVNRENPSCFYNDALSKSNDLLHLGINVNLAPVADVSTNPEDFIYGRTTGKDANGTASYVYDVVSAMDTAGIGSVMKHFPGYGSNRDTHTGIAIDNRAFSQFWESDFVPFKAGMMAGQNTTAILVSHNIMTCVDQNLPASLSFDVHAILRDDLGFDGVIMTDDLAMDAVAAYSADGAVAVMAIQAGNDLIITSDYQNQIPQVLTALDEGTLTINQIENACRRVLLWKEHLGLLE